MTHNNVENIGPDSVLSVTHFPFSDVVFMKRSVSDGGRPILPYVNDESLWFGSRGTIPKRTRSFLEELGVDIKDVARLAENIVLDSLGIIHHHVNG
ncbi:unnamed protein product [Nezara viridula]|uniref:Uncharacterized protein n=1 Tax=Nezara viridula TaxID=85310 RepID=A0A9P0EGE9_NEZVI|nr:unnamed protein product [Nezara viridula]